MTYAQEQQHRKDFIDRIITSFPDDYERISGYSKAEVKVYLSGYVPDQVINDFFDTMAKLGQQICKGSL